ncbi:MAG: thioredoxin [Bacteroidetes bacterium GWF2_41_61]|nr:MAG: thioredoxin [Bacteroidetes bacterium GWE2_40_15]OFY31815.1 MAG: thioredoxin [Bacteroidetes bacterium GWF2_41_61]HBG25040.1 thioredoxin [Rikenellaceae bacterium]HBZ24870.1 thioredoxin [Rikenellaceae bacterium]
MMKILKMIFPLILTVVAVTSCGSRATDNKNKQSDDSQKRAVITITTDEFVKKVADFKSNSQEWKYLGDKPAILDFYADWCVYCKKLSPVLEELAKEYQGKIYIYKIDTEKEREIAAAFGIRALPTLLFIPMNQDPQIAQGAVPKDELKKIIDSLLLK